MNTRPDSRSHLRRAALLATACLLPVSVRAEFLFVTFKGEATAMEEQVYFGISEDGRAWQLLNEGKPTLVSGLGEKGARDPYIIRAHDEEKFYLIATDLSIFHHPDWTRAVQRGSRSILVWESRDLVSWSEPRLVEVAPPDAGCTWAPEAVQDKENGDTIVFWASTTRRDNFEKHRIWAARTRDFRTFGEPFVFIEKPTTIIDTTIVHDGRRYFRFTKDEKFKAITLETASALAGPWTDVPQFNLAQLKGYEGPACYQVAPARDGEPPTWCLILDHYAKGLGYEPFVTRDLGSGKFEPAEGFSFPFRFRHGSVLPISSAEYQRLGAGSHPAAQPLSRAGPAP